MKFSMFCGQTDSVLQNAEEIYLRKKDYDMLIDLIDKYPEKDFVIEADENTNWKEVSAFNKRIKGTIYCCLENIYLFTDCKNNDLKFFYAYPVTSFFELKGLQKLGVSYVRLGMPLFFQMSQVMTFGIPIRITPNKAYEAYIPRENGIYGQWVRPEDLMLYEEYCAGEPVCEFRPFQTFANPDGDGNPLIYEKTLLDIYKNRKTWDGRLKYLIQDIGVDNFNSTIDDEFGKKRINCGQVCQLNRCHYCDMAIRYDEIALKYKENKLEKENSN